MVKHLASFVDDRILTVPCVPLETAVEHLQGLLPFPDVSDFISNGDALNSLVLASLLARVLPSGVAIVGRVMPDSKLHNVFTTEVCRAFFDTCASAMQNLPYGGLGMDDFGAAYRTLSQGNVPFVNLPRSLWNNALDVAQFAAALGGALRSALLGHETDSLSCWETSGVRRVASLNEEKPQMEVDETSMKMLKEMDALMDLIDKRVQMALEGPPLVVIPDKAPVEERKISVDYSQLVGELTGQVEQLQNEKLESIRCLAEAEKRWADARYQLEAQEVALGEVDALRKAESEMLQMASDLRESAAFNEGLNKKLNLEVQESRKQIKGGVVFDIGCRPVGASRAVPTTAAETWRYDW